MGRSFDARVGIKPDDQRRRSLSVDARRGKVGRTGTLLLAGGIGLGGLGVSGLLAGCTTDTGGSSTVATASVRPTASGIEGRPSPTPSAKFIGPSAIPTEQNPSGDPYNYEDIPTDAAGTMPSGSRRPDGTPSSYRETTEASLVRNPVRFPRNVCFDLVNGMVAPGTRTDVSIPTTMDSHLDGLYVGLSSGNYAIPAVVPDSPSSEYSPGAAELTLANAQGDQPVPEIFCGNSAKVPRNSSFGEELRGHGDRYDRVFDVTIVDFPDRLPDDVSVPPSSI